MVDKTKENPLSKLIRTPQIYVKLPSVGRYSKDKIEFTATGELPVRALTARDNLLLKNPDALLNGDAVEQMIKSCVPEIHNVRELPMNDVDLLVLAIQYASKGDKITFDAECPKCKTKNTIHKGIRHMIEMSSEIPEINVVKLEEVDSNNEKINVEIVLRPHTFENHLRASISDFESKKRLSYIRSLYDIEAEKKETVDEKVVRSNEMESIVRDQMKEIFKSMADLTLNLMIESIIQINMICEKTGVNVVTDRAFIKEYIWPLEEDKMSAIRTKMQEVMTYGVNKKTHVTCSNEVCKHEWDVEVGYDQSNFFAVGS